MVRLSSMLMICLAALGACQRQAPQQNAHTEIVNADAERLKGLSTPLRNVGLRNTIRDSGAKCDRVDASGYQQEYRKLSMWTAHCVDSGAFAVFVGANGEAQVRSCAAAADLGIPECRPIAASPPEQANPAPANAAG